MADYREMWKSLGMDLETHDVLCDVLPVAFTDVYLSQENRPENMGYYDFVVSEIHGVRPAELIEAQKNGKKVFGTFCIFVPDEIIFGADAIATGLCGGSQFWVPGGEKVLPTNTCPLIKASVGARLDRTCPFFRIADMYIGETTCDGKKKAWEILGEDVPMHVMDLPQMKRRKDYKAWAEEIMTLKATVEEFTGNKVDSESLKSSIKLINDKRRALARLSEFRKNKNIPISGKDCLLISQIAFYDDPTRFAQMTNALCDELDQRVKDNVSVFPAGTKRILIAGTPLAIPNWKLHNIVETSGGAVVCEEMCTGTRYFENLVDESKETLEEQVDALAERYMGINCACFTPNNARIDDIIRLCKEYDVDGVIDVNLKFCNLYDTEGFIVERALKDAGIPVLGIETDYTDSDVQQLRTRIGAFIEMLGE
ncbi:double-cubane-cluster-containing anaerobic reductase [Peptostreptococcus porci]|uniref:2-hydroxyacyl-CoA dehydratase n=1 Tax=Peptostreptococcus porci TaxID=2652282 RepID=A0A6N7X283_9FIRM|nr:double-cubane-cluster-containing anaerobic reductase [Peptostreptococcus porci]MDD7183457.1 double-cubane-cluster-containing anaerobic reductase [Peptostreptococcus porci]MDY2794473.1 double-cubane-cluster-containing anaerobic reductase [Peptostreptococcus porci]MDY4561732.1 double-cubane-cluster-containing anaerobic reductase [Peptostreptococcus porci]MDY5435951.1 double-cubane-cluster-containing anaerobic reductase [Peptostreptococcus porci]MDY5479044.1 double-cubane-cluster-containing an